jgi:hypothetical protein
MNSCQTPVYTPEFFYYLTPGPSPSQMERGRALE